MKRLFVGGTGLAALSTVISLLDRGFRFEEITFFEKRNHPGGNVWDFDRGKNITDTGFISFIPIPPK